jgi:hypothetical protein
LVRVAFMAIGLLTASASMANASAVVEISGNFGSFAWGNQPTPLNDGSFAGTVTLPSLPAANSSVLATSADVNFYDSNGHLLFNVGGFGSYDVLTANSSGYTSLTVSGIGLAGGTPYDVAPLGLVFNWPFSSATGTVIPYGPASNYSSAIEFTDLSGGTTYFAPVVSGQASAVPEPATIGLSLVGILGVVLHVRYARRRTAA